MRKLLAATCLTPLSFALLPAIANAETVISTALTTPVLTSAGNDDVRISSTGSVKPAAGNAVTIDSNDSVKNEGTIQITGSNNSAGIVANPGLTGNINNTGTITIDEAYTPTDTDNDGDIDGVFAQGSGRFGIHGCNLLVFTDGVAQAGDSAARNAKLFASRRVNFLQLGDTLIGKFEVVAVGKGDPWRGAG